MTSPGRHAELYNSPRWRALAKAFLKRNPYCAMCRTDGRLVQATIVDHRTPHRGDHALFWDEGNLQPICRTHHNSTKQRMERNPHSAPPGTDAAGLPTDPSHPWYRASRAPRRKS